MRIWYRWKNWGKKLENKLIVVRKDSRILAAQMENGRACALSCYDQEEASLLGNIYVGRVQKVVKNIGAAFIEIEKGFPCYYPLDDCENPIYTKKINSPAMVAGDEVLVQVKREALKTKPPALTTNLNFTGKYLVLTTGERRIGVSAKLDRETKDRLKSLIASVSDGNYGFIVRTNAAFAGEDEILKEAKELTILCETLIERAKYRRCYTRMYQLPAPWISLLRDTYGRSLSIVTDDVMLYEQMKDYLTSRQPEDLPRLSLYEDQLLPLYKLCRLEREFKEALSERVWLKSGAYLVIQPTEALTVIDVNTGKYESKKKKQETFLKINLEAAQEIARQLRLRNLSGIIIADFINMEAEEDRKTLMQALEDALHRDPVKTVLVDMTALNLVEITRKKVRKPLAEQIGRIPSWPNYTFSRSAQ